MNSPAEATSTNTSSSNNASSTIISNESSLSTLKQQIHQARIVASTRRRAISSSRDEIFSDLEQAETIVLALLQCASEVSESLSKMATARSRHLIDDDDHRDGDNNNNDDTNEEESFEQLASQVRANGVGYLAGVTKLHGLLTPHAELVKSYRNHSAATAAASALNGNQNETSSSDTTDNNGQLKQSSEIASFDPRSSEIVQMATSNMYAARVEKRLAVERMEILKEMIRLEEEEMTKLDSNSSSIDGGDLQSNKRKR